MLIDKIKRRKIEEILGKLQEELAKRSDRDSKMTHDLIKMKQDALKVAEEARAKDLDLIANLVYFDLTDKKVALKPPPVTTYKSIKPSMPKLVVPIPLDSPKTQKRVSCIFCNLRLALMGDKIEHLKITDICPPCQFKLTPENPEDDLYLVAQQNIEDILILYRQAVTSNRVKRIQVPNFQANLSAALVEIIKDHITTLVELKAKFNSELGIDRNSMKNMREIDDVILQMTRIILRLINMTVSRVKDRAGEPYQESLRQQFYWYRNQQLDRYQEGKGYHPTHENELSHIVWRLARYIPSIDRTQVTIDMTQVIKLLSWVIYETHLMAKLGGIRLVEGNYKSMITELDIRYLLPVEAARYNSVEKILIALNFNSLNTPKGLYGRNL